MPRRRFLHSVPEGFVILPPVSPFFARLGKVYIRDLGDDAPPVYGLHIRRKHTNRHGTGHGGFLATLADTFMAGLVHHRRPEVGRLWTLRLGVEYKRPATMGAWLECHLGSIERDGDFVTIHCNLRIEDIIAAKANAVFKVEDRQRGS
jgi:uncharacterized protein (TIGR00369 family)